MSIWLTLGVFALIQKGHLPFSEKAVHPETMSLLVGISVTLLAREIFNENSVMCCQVPDDSASSLGPLQESLQRGDTALLLREKQMNLIQYLGKFSSASENSVVVNLIKKLLSDCHNKLSGQKIKKIG